ncbi:hypothetical protein [Pedobacter frigidisoli]|uniref:hypothetical protein n=1 Tax=Pedobacter frigidisoli TaxID=2530455 RepID=UPI00292EA286|nr:hypothetical protein [Pedobacter frigidisoli]
MKRRSLVTFLLLGLICKETNAQTDSSFQSLKGQQSLQLNLGTQGIVAEYVYGVLPEMALRGGLNFIPLKANNVFKISGFNSTSNLSADFYNIHVLADYVPAKNLSWFRVVGGFAYFLKARGDIRVIPSDDYKYGDLVLNEDQIGYVDLTVDWKGFAPYLGIALAHTFPKKNFNVSVDLGTYYLTKPKADITGTGLLEGNSSQTPQFQSNIKDYRWLPAIQVNFSYKFKNN